MAAKAIFPFMNVQFLLGVGLGLAGLSGYYLRRGWRWDRDEWVAAVVRTNHRGRYSGM